MMIQDIDNAEKVAIQWLNIAPSDIRCYMVYFNILMSKGEYDKAEKVLEDAEKFANDNEENALPIESSRVMLYITVADVTSGDLSADYNNRAYGLLTAIISSGMAGDEQANELKLTLAELCMKMGRTDEAIEVAESLTDPNKAAAKSEEAAATPAVDGEPSAEELDEMLSDAMEKLDEKIANDEVQIELDDEGNPIADVDLIGDGTSDVAKLIEEEAAQAEAEYGTDFGDRLEFILLSCYALKENYKKVIEISKELKNSDNEYYSYFSHYSEAFSVKQLADRNDGFTKEEADRIYEEKIAYFRSKMINKEGSAFAVIFRARMYAETGKFAKAEEMSSLMSEEDKASVDQYIEMCKEELSAKK
jgi:tetratricopeptide (TPR) repeat protein